MSVRWALGFAVGVVVALHSDVVYWAECYAPEPVIPRYGFPFPWVQWAGSSLEYTWDPVALLVDAMPMAVLVGLLWRRPSRRAAGTAGLVAVAEVVRVVLVGTLVGLYHVGCVPPPSPRDSLALAGDDGRWAYEVTSPCAPGTRGLGSDEPRGRTDGGR